MELVELIPYALGGLAGGGVVWLVMMAYQLRRDNDRLAAEVARLAKLLANLERVSRNKLYREAIEDKQTQAVQAARRLLVAQRDIEDALRLLRLDPKE